MRQNGKTIIWLAHDGNFSGANMAMLEFAHVLRDLYKFHFIIPFSGTMVPILKERGYSFSVIKQYGWAVPASTVRMPSFRKKMRNLVALMQIKDCVRRLRARMIFTNSQPLYLSAKAADQLRLPHVWWLHEFGEEDFGFSTGFGKRPGAVQLMRKSLLLIANSDAVKKKFQVLLPSAAIERIYQPVTIGLPGSAHTTRRAFVVFGQIRASKGIDMIIKAVELATQIAVQQQPYLDIIGPAEDERYLSELRTYISEADLADHVTIRTGFFKKEEIIPNYSALICASAHEAFGRTITEAVKLKVPVIVRNSGGAAEQVNDSNGMLFNTVDELAQILRTFDPSRYPRPGLSYFEEAESKKLRTFLAEIA